MNLVVPYHGESLKSVSRRCTGLYICPKGVDGKRLGPLTVYAGKSPNGKNYVGDKYFNFRRVEPHWAVVDAFAQKIHENLVQSKLLDTFDTVIGVPNGGRTLGQAQGRLSNKRFVYPDKVPKPTVTGQKQEYFWDLSQFDFERGERVAVFEDVCNNMQNTDNTLAEIVKTGAQVVLLGCAFNRSPIADKSYTPQSGPYANVSIPLISAIRDPFPEFAQDDAEVVKDAVAGNIEFEVKKHWGRLMEVMGEYPDANFGY